MQLGRGHRLSRHAGGPGRSSGEAASRRTIGSRRSSWVSSTACRFRCGRRQSGATARDSSGTKDTKVTKIDFDRLRGFALCFLSIVVVKREPDVHHQAVAAPPNVSPWNGRRGGAAVSRSDGPGHDGDGEDRREPAAPLGRGVLPERRDHGAVEPGGRGHRLRVLADPEAARAVPRLAGRGEQPDAGGHARRAITRSAPRAG